MFLSLRQRILGAPGGFHNGPLLGPPGHRGGRYPRSVHETLGIVDHAGDGTVSVLPPSFESGGIRLLAHGTKERKGRRIRRLSSGGGSHRLGPTFPLKGPGLGLGLSLLLGVDLFLQAFRPQGLSFLCRFGLL